MDAINYELIPYSLKLRHSQKMRKGFLLRLEKEGRIGWGEIAPLEGWSQEPLESAYQQTLNFLASTIPEDALYPSVHFGIDCALRHCMHPEEWAACEIPLCGLLFGSIDAILKDAEEMQRQGIQTVKVKIASLHAAEAISLIRTLSKMFRIRLDLNQQWERQKLWKFLEAFTPESFEYIEEPVAEWQELFSFPFPFALDESLSSLKDLNVLKEFPSLKTLILHPTFLGGLQRIASWKELGLPISLSGAYESGLGIWHIAQMARTLGIAEAPLGLDTYRSMEEDLLFEKLQIAHGKLLIPSAVRIPDPRCSCSDL